MRIAITTTQVPFIKGGAEIMVEGLEKALIKHGHETEIISIPFRFNRNEVWKAMEMWDAQSFETFECGRIDRVICLKFPSFYLKSENKYVWLMHQHRSVYELFGTPYGEPSDDSIALTLKSEITKRDTISLSEAKKVFTISKRVSDRLKQFNGVNSIPLYQPPKLANSLRTGDQLPYIYFPSRLETLKRQELLIRSIQYMKSPCVIVISGDGGQWQYLNSLVTELGVSSRVKMLGRVNDDELIRWYSNSLGIFFGPYEEDYGFITLEAMLSAKPIITCNDSGGPLEFVIDGETGYITEPLAEAVAEAVDKLYFNRSKAKEMGFNGLQRYRDLRIDWDNVVEQLLSNH
ncbi:glycosyltransferase family 4 protein [Nitrosomonas communis]|uniref:Glycosyltransferase involved in cell wall bisynthesis n=1 Tax=Nitrosomonas communis TaxID=44574 RepID=A0A1I4MRR4_9PROT|nr:glycosyltransferase family 4 protein [Nitrosomonas communis]SFM05939.1 Glycosyltransferase involved in cell wall bisynthesis [Nitrosomonas communis]